MEGSSLFEDSGPFLSVILFFMLAACGQYTKDITVKEDTDKQEENKKEDNSKAKEQFL
ncbi:hypothetical protein [Neobacillus sp. PS2-9]|uniref:hypothetical protein n=1 Tax=Neobacillus sp. PS2-9 TaxID=3070676 RepID=UPI0027E12189|nr:hypothetical protein [Neobacillus sp. PS2-9]WML55981.1 hypothetical protein RCG25_13590 [Neobacillus sp. PS2-9]